MDLQEAIRTRRSIRAYKPDPIDDETLNRVLEAVRIAPSGSNRQPWRFILVKNEELKKRLAAACNKQAFIAEGPLVVVACGFKIPIDRGGYMGNMGMLVDVSIAFTHLMLAARAEGLGTCWIGAFDNNEVKKLLKIPEDVNVVAVSPLGYPRQGFSNPGARKQMDEIVSVDKF